MSDNTTTTEILIVDALGPDAHATATRVLTELRQQPDPTNAHVRMIQAPA